MIPWAMSTTGIKWLELHELLHSQTRGERKSVERARHQLCTTLAALAVRCADGFTLPHALDSCRVPRVRGVAWWDLGLNDVPVFREWLREVQGLYAQHTENNLRHHRFNQAKNAAGERMMSKALLEANRLSEAVPSWLDADRERSVAQGLLDCTAVRAIRRDQRALGNASTFPSPKHKLEVENVLRRGIYPSDFWSELSTQLELRQDEAGQGLSRGLRAV